MFQKITQFAFTSKMHANIYFGREQAGEEPKVNGEMPAISLRSLSTNESPFVTLTVNLFRQNVSRSCEKLFSKYFWIVRKITSNQVDIIFYWDSA